MIYSVQENIAEGRNQAVEVGIVLILVAHNPTPWLIPDPRGLILHEPVPGMQLGVMPVEGLAVLSH